MSFEVHGATEAELFARAGETLERLSPGAKWELDLHAQPEVRRGDGQVEIWRGDVEARNPARWGKV